MKGEHWKTLESIVGTSLNVEELTLFVLDEINIFSYGTEIQEVTHEYGSEMSFSCCTLVEAIFSCNAKYNNTNKLEI